jgi:hypothetical protein
MISSVAVIGVSTTNSFFKNISRSFFENCVVFQVTPIIGLFSSVCFLSTRKVKQNIKPNAIQIKGDKVVKY